MSGSVRRVGMVLTRPSRVFADEPFYHEFVQGFERVAPAADLSLLLVVAGSREEEVRRYERWAADGDVAALLLTDCEEGDDRVALVERLGLPTVVVGPPSVSADATVVRTEDDGAMREAVRHLVGSGARALAHVTGPVALAHTRERVSAFATECGAVGATGWSVEGDYSRAAGRALVERMLASARRPDAIVFDNDLMALGGLEAARASGVAVPEALSLVAWDDSPLCQLATPPLSALSHDVQAAGELAVRAVAAVLAGEPRSVLEAPRARLVVRGT